MEHDCKALNRCRLLRLVVGIEPGEFESGRLILSTERMLQGNLSAILPGRAGHRECGTARTAAATALASATRCAAWRATTRRSAGTGASLAAALTTCGRCLRGHTNGDRDDHC